MEKKKKKLSVSLSVLFIVFLISSSSLNINSTKAQLEGEYNLFSTDSFDRSTWKWSTTEVVSTETLHDSWFPSLAVDTLGNVHIAWYDYTDYAGSGSDIDIFYKRWNASSSSWTTTEVISTESTGQSSNPSLAVDTLGNVHIAWDDWTFNYAGSGGDLDIFYKRWDASTFSWTTTEVVSTESTTYSYSPSLVVNTLGDVHIAWYDYTNYAGAGGTDFDIFYKCWNASSSSWTASEVVSTESTEHSYIPSLAVDTLGNVHIAWKDETDYTGSGADTDSFYKRWDTASSTWTTTEVVSNESTAESHRLSLAVDSANSVHIAWEDWTDYAGSGTDGDIFYKCLDAFSSWTVTEVVSTESTGACYSPSLAVDSAGTVHVTWQDLTDYAGAGTDYDIIYKRWNASSSSWTASEVVSTESTEESRLPSLVVDTLGKVHIAWEDKTNYTGSGSDRDIFYKFLAPPPIAPVLSPILPNPTNISTISLDWNDVPDASLYYIYCSTSNILSVEGLTPIGNTVTSFYGDILPTEGTFYYVIVANNFAGNSTLSNCESVVYALPVIYEFSTISGLLLATFAFLIVILRTRKKNSKLN